MPASSVRTFVDPGDYAAAIRATTIDLTVRDRGRFTAKRTRIDFHRLWMQRLFESGARTLHSSFVPERAIVTFSTEPGPSLFWSGTELRPGSLIRHNEGEDAFQHSSGPTSWGAMSLPMPDMISAGATIAGLDLAPPQEPLTITPTAAAMGKLQRLHAAAGALAEDAPAVIEHPEAARGLEQALLHALMQCLGGEETQPDSTASRQHTAIMRRFHRMIEAHIDQPLYISDLCHAIGTSERTLRSCCEEHLGMGPKRYLLLRRMHMVRRALRASSPAQTTVTEIATRYGFWQFGRLAVEYNGLFDEAPSATLAKPNR